MMFLHLVHFRIRDGLGAIRNGDGRRAGIRRLAGTPLESSATLFCCTPLSTLEQKSNYWSIDLTKWPICFSSLSAGGCIKARESYQEEV